ncbi:MAG: hypothetical protein H0U16_12305 [Actinobacteria bacterium]|nr:hypothetical protein [Actinomycetota bacterium]
MPRSAVLASTWGLSWILSPADRRGGGRRVARAAVQTSNGGDLGFEPTLWQAADQLRGNLDAREWAERNLREPQDHLELPERLELQ